MRVDFVSTDEYGSYAIPCPDCGSHITVTCEQIELLYRMHLVACYQALKENQKEEDGSGLGSA